MQQAKFREVSECFRRSERVDFLVVYGLSLLCGRTPLLFDNMLCRSFTISGRCFSIVKAPFVQLK